MSHTYSIRPYALCSDPYLPSVRRAFILTLTTEHGTRRMAMRDKREPLYKLCRKTYVQYNTPWDVCGTKPSHVHNTATDLVHAYTHLARHVLETMKPGEDHVLFLEDDAEILRDDPRLFREVDTFLNENEYDIYSLASFGVTTRYKQNHRRFGSLFGFSQAIVWHRNALHRLLQSNVKEHIDVHFLGSLSRKFTHRTPLVVQTFEDTPNTKTWCFQCKQSSLEKHAVRTWLFLLQDVLKLRTQPHGWHILQRMGHVENMVVVLVVIACVCIRLQGNVHPIYKSS